MPRLSLTAAPKPSGQPGRLRAQVNGCPSILEACTQISGITHALGLSPYGFPRRLAIDVSIDGATWDQAWEGSTVAHAFRAAVRAPTAAVMPFAFAPRPGRFVRLRQLASHPFPWLVAEIQVHGPGD